LVHVSVIKKSQPYIKTTGGLPARISLNRKSEESSHENHRIAMRTCIRSEQHCLRGTGRSATIQAAGGLQENAERSELQEEVSSPRRQIAFAAHRLVRCFFAERNAFAKFFL